MFGRATIRLGIGPHSSYFLKITVLVCFVNCTTCLANKDVYKILECGPMPDVMAALPNIGGAICSTLQSLADTHY